MKEVLKGMGILLYFIICQCVATFVIMFVKVYIDPDWLYALALYDITMFSRKNIYL